MKLFENKIYSKEKGRFCFARQDLIELADKYGTPLYVFSEKELKNNVREILDKFREHHVNTSIHYAAKCESTVANMQILKGTRLCSME